MPSITHSPLENPFNRCHLPFCYKGAAQSSATLYEWITGEIGPGCTAAWAPQRTLNIAAFLSSFPVNYPIKEWGNYGYWLHQATARHRYSSVLGPSILGVFGPQIQRLG